MNIIKRNGTEVQFDLSKIINAITKANNEMTSSKDALTREEIINIANDIRIKCNKYERAIDIEEIQNMVEEEIMIKNKYSLAKAYITYRYIRNLNRQSNTTDASIFAIIEGQSEVAKQENSNKNPLQENIKRDYIAGEVSKDVTKRFLLPKKIIDAHEQGIIHFHDSDYFIQHFHNCDLVNLEDMLQNGTVISGRKIDKPHSFQTACTVTTQIIAQVASSQYGGQSISLSHIAPFVDISRQKYINEVKKELEFIKKNLSKEEFLIKVNEIAEQRTLKEIKSGVQTIQYQVETLMTTNGQAPFITVFMYLNEVKDDQTKHDLSLIIEEVLKQRILGVKNEQGIYIAPAFPKLIYVLEEDNITENSKYWYLTKLSAECTSKRLVPDYISEKKMMELKEGNCFPVMGCRSALSPWKDENGKYKFYGRFNMGVVTINLIDVALSSNGNIEAFWKIFDERLDLCKEALMCRYNRLKGTKSDVAPILWQYGALARLKPGETIDKLLVGGYSTISLGYAGLYECVKYMTDLSHTDPMITPFSDEIMKHMYDKCNKWKEETNLGFSVYGSPIESTTYKFAKCLQKRFGKIKGITDRNFITNSCHVFVEENINAFDKLTFEAHYQKWSSGGMISYIEVPDLKSNLPAIISVIQHIYNNSMYAEINTKSCYCQVCGYEGDIPIVKDEKSKKLIWKCPCCKNIDHDKMNIAVRVCGYISTNDMNQGRMDDVRNRVLHL